MLLKYFLIYFVFTRLSIESPFIATNRHSDDPTINTTYWAAFDATVSAAIMSAHFESHKSALLPTLLATFWQSHSSTVQSTVRPTHI